MILTIVFFIPMVIVLALAINSYIVMRNFEKELEKDLEKNEKMVNEKFNIR